MGGGLKGEATDCPSLSVFKRVPWHQRTSEQAQVTAGFPDFRRVKFLQASRHAQARTHASQPFRQ